MSANIASVINLIQKSKISEELVCPNCSALLENPRSLKCFHSLCEKCLNDLVDDSGDEKLIYCPICTDRTDVPDGDVSRLPMNEIASKIALKLSSEPDDVIFTLCEEHKKKEVDIYCDTCNELVCSQCVTTTHKNHKFENVKEVFHRHLDKLNKEVVSAKLVATDLEKALKTSGKSRERLDINAEEAKKEIKKLFDALGRIVEKRRRELLEDVDELYEKKKLAYELHLGYLREESAQAKSIIELNQMAAVRDDYANLLFIVMEKRKKIEAFARRRYKLELNESSDIYLQCESKLDKITKEMGECIRVVEKHPAFGRNWEVVGMDEIIHADVSTEEHEKEAKEAVVAIKQEQQ